MCVTRVQLTLITDRDMPRRALDATVAYMRRYAGFSLLYLFCEFVPSLLCLLLQLWQVFEEYAFTVMRYFDWVKWFLDLSMTDTILEFFVLYKIFTHYCSLQHAFVQQDCFPKDLIITIYQSVLMYC